MLAFVYFLFNIILSRIKPSFIYNTPFFATLRLTHSVYVVILVVRRRGMNKKLYTFKTSEGDFVFDGDNVCVYQCENETSKRSSSDLYSTSIDNHRPRFFKTICLILNNSCNLSCKYCYAHQGVYDKPLAQLSYEKAIEGIDFIARSAIAHNSNKMTVAFFGGEPLLSFNLIKQLVDYAENTYPYLVKKYQITTNGTLINLEIAQFMEKYNFNIMVSIDGNQKFHDYYRCYKNGQGSYKDVVKGISFISNKFLLNARITITDINPLIHEYIDDILQLGIKRITFAIDYNVREDSFDLYINALKSLAQKYINDIKKGIYYDVTNLTRIVSYVIFHNKCRAHCNAGISYITMSADGKYYPCPRFVGISGCCIGKDQKSVVDYTNQLNDKIKNSAIDRSADCKNCCFSYICGGVCMHHAYVMNGHIFNTVNRECVERKTIFKEALNLLCSLSVIERRKFLLFLNMIWEKNNIKGGEE